MIDYGQKSKMLNFYVLQIESINFCLLLIINFFLVHMLKKEKKIRKKSLVPRIKNPQGVT